MKALPWIVVAALLVASLMAREANACAGCRNPSLAVGRNNDGPIDDGSLRLGATVTGTTVHVVHEAGCVDTTDCDEVPVQPLYLHDQYLYPVELRVTGEYAFDGNYGLELQLPFRAVTTTIEYTTPSGAPYEPEDAGVHHRDETVAGFADAWLLFRAGTLVNKWWLAARPGVSLPLGKTRENPFARGDQGLRHQHIQLGSGTFDPLLVLEAFRQYDAIKLAVFAQGQTSLYENSHGYRAPWKVYAGASVGTTLIGNLSGSIGPEAFHEDAERWDGAVRQDGNLGRTEILAGLGLSQRIDKTELSLGARFPLWRKIVPGDDSPGTLSSPATVFVGVSHSLSDGGQNDD